MRTAAAPSRPRPVAGNAGWRLLRRELVSRRRRLVPVLGWSAVEALPSLLSGWLVAMAADQGFLAGRPEVGVAWLGAFGACQLLRVLATRALLPRLADVVEPVRDAIVTRVVRGALRRAVHGSERPDTAAMARLTEQVQSIRGLLSALLLDVRGVAVSVLTACVGLAALSPVLAGLAVVPVLVCMGAFAWLMRRLRTLQDTVLAADEAIARDTVASLEGMRDVVACGAQGRTAAVLGAAIDAQARAERRLGTAEATRGLLTAAAEGLPLVAVLLATPWLVGGGQLEPGQVLGAITYVVTGLQPAVSALLRALGGVGLQLGVTLDRIARTSVVPPPPVGPGAVPLHSALHVDRLTFAYGPGADPVIRDLTFTVGEGEHLAVVGPSGAGKSTLVDLLTGLVRGSQGVVRLGGVPLSDVDERHLRATLALVPRESYVVAGTLRDNLRYLAPAASDADLDRAVAVLGMQDLVRRLGGFDAELAAPGSELSPADEQLVVLARTYLSPARVVVLDEGTCHLDPAAEEVAELAFRDRPGTLIVVAHRMSSAGRAQRVLVMDGTSVQLGDHRFLLGASPMYRELTGGWPGSVAATPPRPVAGVSPVRQDVLAMLPDGLRDRMRVTFCEARDADPLAVALALCRRPGRHDVVTLTAGSAPAHLAALGPAGPTATLPAAVLIETWTLADRSRPGPSPLVQHVRAVTRTLGVPLVVDERRSAGGRTGRWFAFEHDGIEPDVVIASDTVVIHDARLDGGRPGATQLGVAEQRLLDNATARGRQIATRLAGLAVHPGVRRISGRGLLWEIELADPETAGRAQAGAGTDAALEIDGTVIRLSPPPDVSGEAVDLACSIVVHAVEGAHLDGRMRNTRPLVPGPSPRPHVA
jgi:ATP-binding cassette subfamily C protein